MQHQKEQRPLRSKQEAHQLRKRYEQEEQSLIRSIPNGGPRSGARKARLAEVRRLKRELERHIAIS